MKHTMLVLPLIWLLLAGCIANPPAAPAPVPSPPPAGGQSLDFTYYSSPMYLIYYPRGWQAEEPQNGVLVISAPRDGDHPVNQFIVEIWNGNESTPVEFEAYERSLMKAGDSTISKSSTLFKGRQAFVMETEGTAEDGRTRLLYKTLFFRRAEWVYRLSYSIVKDQADAYQPIMEAMLDRFVIGSY